MGESELYEKRKIEKMIAKKSEMKKLDICLCKAAYLAQNLIKLKEFKEKFFQI